MKKLPKLSEVNLMVGMTKMEYKKLEALAKFRKKTCEECILDFIRYSQPGGTGWSQPWVIGRGRTRDSLP